MVIMYGNFALIMYVSLYYNWIFENILKWDKGEKNQKFYFDAMFIYFCLIFIAINTK